MPNVQEMLNDPRAAAEGLAKARSLRPEHLSELVRTQKKEAEDATSSLRQKWDQWFRLWLNDVDFSAKEDWQTKIWVGKVFSAVEQATALIQRSLLESPDSFGIEGFDVNDKELAKNLWSPMLKMFLTNAHLVYKFTDACKMGFITGTAGYLKMRPVAINVPRLMSAEFNPAMQQVLPSFQYAPRTFLALDFVMPWNIRRDPRSVPRENFSGTYLYHSEYKDKSSLSKMVDHGWNQEALDRLLASEDKGIGNGWDLQRREQEFKMFHSFYRHKFRKEYMVDEGWLDVLDENGEVIYPNALMVHSNDQILYGPVDNPIWATDLSTGRRKWPFVAGAPIVHPFRFEGRGIVEQDASLAALYSNVFMLWADGLNWAVNPPTEIHQDALVDWEDLEHYPGKLWVKHTSEPALTPAAIGKMDTNEVMAALEYIDRTRQNVTFVTDFAVGLPGSRSEITKGEVQIKTSQSLAIFESMGKNLEHMGQEIVELAYDMILQFFDQYADPSVERILGPEAQFFLSQMPVEQRIEALQGNYDFSFTGVTAALQKSDLMNRVMQFATLAAAPGYQGLTNPSQILKVLSELLGISDRIDVSQEPMVSMSQVQQLMMGAQQGMGGEGPTEAAQPTDAPPQQGMM
jgi:hypothetical protein